MSGALTGLRVLDLSRVLAGPVATQIMGDLGADILKIEKPGAGDDTRAWGPPFLKDAAGQDTSESAYYLSANRNKRSLALDISKAEGQAVILQLLEHCDVLIENFKVGGLDKYGLGYHQLKERFPRLVYCSITGFGLNGPLATEPGYDFVSQGMGGLMAVTGGTTSPPSKAGVAVSDYVTGLYAVIGILSALRSRDATGKGQLVDCALLDSTIAMMTNLAQFYLTSRNNPPRLGNAHASIVPYQEFATTDGHVIVAVGNDHQFQVFCRVLGHTEWTEDKRFATNAARVTHRDHLVPLLADVMSKKTTADWVEALRDADVPCGPILKMDQVFAEPQAQARAMAVPMTHPLAPNPIDLVGSPLKLSGTPVEYRAAPPMMGQHTDEVLREILKMSEGDIKKLRAQKIIG